VRQIRALSHVGTVLKVASSIGDLYFKASYDRAPSEVSLLRFLASRWPANVTEILAWDERSNWMLMSDASSGESRFPPPESFVRAAEALAKIQVESIPERMVLESLGCEVLNVEGLREFLASDLSISAMPILRAGGLAEDKEADLQILGPRLVELCDRLASYCIPDTLIHPDFRQDNCFVSRHATRIIDWENACIGHPFFSLFDITRYDHFLETDTLEHDSVVRAYLEQFHSFESEKRLLEAMRLSHQLHYAWRLWYRIQQLPYYEPESIAFLASRGFIAKIAVQLLEVHRNNQPEVLIV